MNDLDDENELVFFAPLILVPIIGLRMPLYRLFILPSRRRSPSVCHHLHEGTQGDY